MLRMRSSRPRQASTIIHKSFAFDNNGGIVRMLRQKE